MDARVLMSVQMLGTWFGCGRSPYAPGTVGTLGAIPLAALLYWAGEMPYMSATFVLAAASIWIGQIFEDLLSKEHDPKEFVLDEVVGFLITMTWVPFTVPYVVVGFLLFRLLDVVKPFPISWVDKNVPGGVGAVADDLVAGILANIGMQVVMRYSLLSGF